MLKISGYGPSHLGYEGKNPARDMIGEINLRVHGRKTFLSVDPCNTNLHHLLQDINLQPRTPWGLFGNLFLSTETSGKPSGPA